jgi:endonuclease/exonuclease/phosphatase family metal-dependent hydrolase
MFDFPSRVDGTWRVATWNLWWHFGDDVDRRKTAIRSALSALDADVVCLQEVYGDNAGNSDARELGAALGLRVVPHQGAPTSEASLGNALLSRWPILEAGVEALPGVDDLPSHRHAVWAVLDTRSGHLPVICTHLSHRFDESSLRQRQAAALAGLASRLRSPDPEQSPPVLLCGDLNAVPGSDELRLLTGRAPVPVGGLVFNDCWPQVRDDLGHTWVRRNPHLRDAAWPERRLDYVLVSWPRPTPVGNPAQAFLLGDGPVDGVWPSDHLGVVADLRSGCIPA